MSINQAVSRISLLLWWWFSAPLCVAQPLVQSLTVADGLSQGYVTSVIEDQQGFLWIGTLEGLNRYDGYSIRRYTAHPFDPWALQSSAYVTCLYEDAQRLIWVGTDEGLYVFEPIKERFFRAPLPLRAASIEQIRGDREGNIFVHNTLDQSPKQIFRLPIPHNFARQLQQSTSPALPLDIHRVLVEPQPAEPIFFLECAGDSLLLAYTLNSQLFAYSPAREALVPFEPAHLPASTTADHSIWWGKYTGHTFRRRLPDGRDSMLPHSGWHKTMRFSDGSLGLWVRDDGPLFRKNENTPIESDLALPKSKLLQTPTFQREFTQVMEFNNLWNNQVIADRNGILWMGTGGVGLHKINLRQQAFGRLLAGKSISRLRELPGKQLWVLDYQGGGTLHRLGDLQEISPPWAGQLPYGAVVYDVQQDHTNNYWLVLSGDRVRPLNHVAYWNTAARRLAVLNVTTPHLAAIPDHLFQDRDHNIWVLGHKGVLLRFRNGQFTPETFSYAVFTSEKVESLRGTDIQQDADGRLWIATNQGLLRLDNPNANQLSFTKYEHDPANRQGLNINWITCIFPDPNHPNVLWLGTHGGGINRLQIASGDFLHYTESPNRLPNNVVYGLLNDPLGNLWCSTNRGICRFDPVHQTFVTYQESDGLLSTEFNTNAFLHSTDGRLWFGGVNGLNFFKPEAIAPRRTAPPVAISNLQVQGLHRQPDTEQSLTLPFSENNVTFEFSVLDFSNPATNRYRYRLLPIDRDWINSGTVHSANYGALAPGQYVFEVQGATADSPWSDPLRFYLEIRPPWYRSTAALLAYALLLLLAGWGYLRYREYHFKLRHSAEISQRESTRLKEFDAIKNNFFTNIAHELRTPLTVILGLTDRLRRREPGDDPDLHLQKIARQGQHLLELSTQVLDLARLDSQHLALHYYHGNIADFVREHVEALTPLAANKNVALHLSTEAPSLWMDFDPQQFFKILNNLITNAIRHAPPGQEVRVETRIAEQGHWFELVVADTGEGIAAADLPQLFDRFYQGGQSAGTSGIGLTLTRDLVQLMGGSIAVDSTLGEGATFVVRLPVHHQAPTLVVDLGVTQPVFATPPADLVADLTDDSLPLLLLVEDNPDVADYLQLYLQRHYRLVLATDGADGVAKALEVVPDLIVSDVAMPVKNGFEMTRELKADQRTSHIPVVLLTAKTDIQDRLTGQESGANAYLAKPFNEQELLLVLRNLLLLQKQAQHRYAQYPAAAPAVGSPAAGDFQVEDIFLQRLYQIFEEHFAQENFDLEQLCRLLGMSSSQLDRKIKALTNQSPMLMLRTFRLQKARKMLENSPRPSVSEVCFKTGFKTPAHFSRLFTREFGVPPSEWQ